jgi:hypothetical protein
MPPSVNQSGPYWIWPVFWKKKKEGSMYCTFSSFSKEEKRPKRKTTSPAQPFSIHRQKIHHTRDRDLASSRDRTPTSQANPHGGASAAVPPVELERLLPPRTLLHHNRAAPPLLSPPPACRRRPLRGRLQGHAQGDGLLGSRGKCSAHDSWVSS